MCASGRRERAKGALEGRAHDGGGRRAAGCSCIRAALSMPFCLSVGNVSLAVVSLQISCIYFSTLAILQRSGEPAFSAPWGALASTWHRAPASRYCAVVTAWGSSLSCTSISVSAAGGCCGGSNSATISWILATSGLTTMSYPARRPTI